MLRHTLKILWNERRHNLLLFLELLIVAICFWVVATWIYYPLKIASTPTGFDIDHVYRVMLLSLPSSSPQYKTADHPEYEAIGSSFLSMRDALRRRSDLEAVSVSMVSTPHMWSNRNIALRRDSLQMKSIMLRGVDAHYFDVFRIYDEQGSNEIFKRSLTDDRTITISRAVAQGLFPDDPNPIGKQIGYSDTEGKEFTIVGITADLRQNTYNPWNRSAFFPVFNSDDEALEELNESTIPYVELCIRVKPEADHDYIDHFMREIAPQVNRGNVVVTGLNRMTDLRDVSDATDLNDIKKNLFVFIFFSINVLLGVLGVFWYRTEERRREIGLRLALGRIPAQLTRTYMLEGLLLLLLTLPIALSLFIALWKYEVLKYYWSVDWMQTILTGLFTYLVLGAMILLGVWIPTHRAVRESHALTLKDE